MKKFRKNCGKIVEKLCIFLVMFVCLIFEFFHFDCLLFRNMSVSIKSSKRKRKSTSVYISTNRVIKKTKLAQNINNRSESNNPPSISSATSTRTQKSGTSIKSNINKDGPSNNLHNTRIQQTRKYKIKSKKQTNNEAHQSSTHQSPIYYPLPFNKDTTVKETEINIDVVDDDTNDELFIEAMDDDLDNNSQHQHLQQYMEQHKCYATVAILERHKNVFIMQNYMLINDDTNNKTDEIVQLRYGNYVHVIKRNNAYVCECEIFKKEKTCVHVQLLYKQYLKYIKPNYQVSYLQQISLKDIHLCLYI